MDLKGIIAVLKDKIWDRLIEFRSLPYVALVALVAIVGIAADNGADIHVGNAYFNAARSRNVPTESETTSDPETPTD